MYIDGIKLLLQQIQDYFDAAHPDAPTRGEAYIECQGRLFQKYIVAKITAEALIDASKGKWLDDEDFDQDFVPSVMSALSLYLRHLESSFELEPRYVQQGYKLTKKIGNKDTNIGERND